MVATGPRYVMVSDGSVEAGVRRRTPEDQSLATACW